ncbi:hypothetical protein RFI_11937, partial [Reticulomyxa filosa]
MKSTMDASNTLRFKCSSPFALQQMSQLVDQWNKKGHKDCCPTDPPPPSHSHSHHCHCHGSTSFGNKACPKTSPLAHLLKNVQHMHRNVANPTSFHNKRRNRSTNGNKNKNAKTLAPQQALFAALAAINAAENTSIGMTCGNSDVDIIGSLFEHEEWTSGEDNNDIYIDDDSINYCELGISTPETTATAACHPKTTETKDCKKYPDTSQKLMGLFNDHS